MRTRWRRTGPRVKISYLKALLQQLDTRYKAGSLDTVLVERVWVTTVKCEAGSGMQPNDGLTWR